jgi:alkylation response protein AidB-like acyl-CoA dehydrogenase
VDGHVADLLIVGARAAGTAGGEGLALFTLDADSGGVERRLLESIDPTRKIARIEFRGAHAHLLGSLDDGAAHYIRKATPPAEMRALLSDVFKEYFQAAQP